MTREEAITKYIVPAIEKTWNDKRCKEILEALEQKPKIGYWIDDEFGSKCSCCGIYTHLDKFDRPMKFRCCSMCGAKMVEPQESEESE